MTQRPATVPLPRSVCLHGPESTGKSTLAPRLARHFGSEAVPEYGRAYCEANGTELAMDDLVAIAETHARQIEAARRRSPPPLILDTDPLMTAVWADMLFGRRDPRLDAWDAVADLYLLFAPDLPWIDDGTRFFGEPAARARFFDLSRAELDRRGVRWTLIGGTDPADRFRQVLTAIAGGCAPDRSASETPQGLRHDKVGGGVL